MRVIGTAGHVDHGKSTLVQALTGTHPDRLKEEREREMTIDLGFAFFNLPDGGEVGIVDVPGHRDFIENMLAGVGGIDAALLVVAADEGVMPQTREHLAILDLLQIDGGLVAITKIDIAPEPEWIDLVEQDLKDVLAGSVLDGAPVLRVSARTGEGVAGVAGAIEDLLGKRPKRSDLGRPRLPIDRVFSMPGFGTVVTGTLVDGSLSTGEEVEVQPGGLRARVRGLQTRSLKTDRVAPGSRTAVNLSGVSVDEVTRGGWIVRPNTYPTTRRIDLGVRLLPDARLPLQHDDEIKFFIGAAEVMGRARVLELDALQPGEEGWMQIELRTPVVARRGDRFILRRPSPGETIGGGAVVDPAPARRHRRYDAGLIARLESLSGGTPADIVAHSLAGLGESTAEKLAAASALSLEQVEAILPGMIEDGRAVPMAADTGGAGEAAVVADRGAWEAAREKILEELAAFHRRLPLRSGMPREDLRSRVPGSQRLFNVVMKTLAEEGVLQESQARAALSSHTVQFTPDQQSAIRRWLDLFAENPFSPPTMKEIRADLGEELAEALITQGQLTAVNQDVVFRTGDYEAMEAAVREMIAASGDLTVAQFRDRFETSRKYALAFLEHLDAIGVTERVGDGRRLK